ncbi:hypothetical protein TGMAS_226490 [Toxoplasma gondii MAS]|uniref:Uncharacterized protein n=1 Tax=Toxoplasma gondii MAS TaxID=943118 RepID=A0A086QAR5_TOXGO|nr:hypothetical protein TGMAS_226490 [Toxoplasma gondii MAS]
MFLLITSYSISFVKAIAHLLSALCSYHILQTEYAFVKMRLVTWKKTATNEICWLNKSIRWLTKKTSRQHRPCAGGTDVTHLTVDRDGQVRDNLGQPVPCLDNESSLFYNDSRVASNDKLMNCLYFHSESSKGKKEDVRYSGPPPLVGAPPIALDGLHVKCRAPAEEAAEANPTASVEDPDLQTCASPKQKRDSNNVSRQTTASSA